MTVQECYKRLGGDYGDVLRRLVQPQLVDGLMAMFLQDENFDRLCAGMQAGKREQAFRAAHTLKGVCQNLGFTTLFLSSEKLTDALRHGDEQVPPDAVCLWEAVQRDYQQATAAIRMYMASPARS
nr:Hpt domain-containing protein [bacterium]